jgi:uncharacterized protein (DUF2147 family)
MLLILLMIGSLATDAQQITGKWKVIDEDSGEAKCIIDIFKTDNNTLKGEIIKLLDSDAPKDATCIKCKGKFKDEPLVGLPILRGFTREDDKWVDGQITDPEKGKTYDSKIWVDEDDPDKLKVRGYVSIFYRTQTWERVED